MYNNSVNRAAAYAGKGSLLYQIYKDKIDPETGVPDAYMSIRRAAAFSSVSISLLHRQVKAGLLKTRPRGTRVDVNPSEIVRLNFDKNGNRLLVNLKTGDQKLIRKNARYKEDIYTKSARAIRFYPEWEDEVNDFITYAESKNSITTPRSNGVPISITNMRGDKTGKAAQIMADMPKRLAEKAKWTRVVYEVVIRKKMVLNPETTLTALTFLNMYMWAPNPASHQDTADALGISERTSHRYMQDIRDAVAMEAIRQGLE